MSGSSCPGCGRRARADNYGNCIFCNASLPPAVTTPAPDSKPAGAPTAQQRLAANASPPPRRRSAARMPALTPKLAVAVVVVVLAALAAGVLLVQRSAGPDPRTLRLQQIDRAGGYPADRTLQPAQVVRAYVDAFNRRDGQRLCALLAPHVSGALDLATLDSDGPHRHRDRCPGLAAALVGHPDRQGPRFVVAAVTSQQQPRTVAGMHSVAVKLTVRRRHARTGKQTVSRLRDVVWTAEIDGAVQVVRLSALARAAGLVRGKVPDVDRPPSLQADRRKFEQARAQLKAKERAKLTAYRTPGAPARCPAPVTARDARDDLFEQTGQHTPSDAPQVDLLELSVAVQGEDLCVSWQAAAPIADSRFRVTYRNARGDKNFRQDFWIHLREDGKARVSSDEQTVTAPVGVQGSRMSLTVPADLLARDAPGLDRFGVRVTSLYVGSEAEQMVDAFPDSDTAYLRWPAPRR